MKGFTDKINILVANAKLSTLGGSETFTYTLIEELSKRKNLDVEYFTFKRGLVSERIENDFGVKFKTKPKYDLILANHNTCVTELFNSGFIIQTCHGIYPKLEQPSYLANAHVSISEEVQGHLASLGFSSKIIHNGINLNRFKITNPVNKKLNTVLSLCHSENANQMVKNVCDDLQLNYLQAYKYGEAIWDIERIINEADLVIGLGRSAYEAMACGRPVVVFDDRNYFESCGDGYIRDTLGLSLKNNCSGRYFNTKYTIGSLKKEFLKYNNEDSTFYRNLAEKEFNVSKNLDLYLEYWENINLFQKRKKMYQLKKRFRLIFGNKLTYLLYRFNKSN